MLGKVMDNCLYLWEHHETDRDRDRVDLWYGNVKKFQITGLIQSNLLPCLQGGRVIIL